MNENNVVKKETVYLVALCALVVGFLLGVGFTIFKTDSSPTQSGRPQATQEKPAPKQDYAERVKAIKQELEARPDNVQAWVGLGNAHFDADQPKKAITAYRKALDLDPKNANVWTDLGVMFRRAGKSSEAIAAFDKAGELDPMHISARLNKGIVLLNDFKDKEGAIKAWEEVLAINPEAQMPSGQHLHDLIDKTRAQ